MNHPSVFAYTRRFNNAVALVVLNFKEEEVDFTLPMELAATGEVYIRVLGNYGEEDSILGSFKSLHLKGYEGTLYIKG